MAQIKTKAELLDSLRESIERSKQSREAMERAAGKKESVVEVEASATDNIDI